MFYWNFHVQSCPLAPNYQATYAVAFEFECLSCQHLSSKLNSEGYGGQMWRLQQM